MNKIGLWAAVSASALTVTLFSSAVAAVTYTFAGVITDSREQGSGINPEDNYDRVFDGIEIGTEFEGEFIYDPNCCDQLYYGWASWLTISVNQQVYFGGDYYVDLHGHGDAETSDINHLYYSSSDLGERWIKTIAIEFGSYTDLDDYFGAGPNPLPNTIPDELLLSLITIKYSGDGYGGDYEYSFHLDGEVTSIAEVPIPPAIWLFGSGLIGFIGIARRKKL